MTIRISTPLNIEIRTEAERDIALNLVQKLSGAPENTPEEFRLLMLIEAIEAWDIKRERHQAVKQSAAALVLVWMPAVSSHNWLGLRTG